MDRFQRGFYRLAAENKYLKLKREGFQAWFGEVMEKAHPADYENIRLTQGDGGLDGILISTGTVFQVYAPRNQSASEIVAKVGGDFAKAKQTMEERGAELNSWVFVHNDEGLTKETGPELIKLRQANPSIQIKCWTFEGIWNEIGQLSLDQLTDLFGLSPTEQNVDTLRLQSIREVIDHLQQTEAPTDSDMTMPSAEKLEHNKLSDGNVDLLISGRRKQGLVAEYLAGRTDPTAGERIAEAFRDEYDRLRVSAMAADDIFRVLWDFAGGNHFTTPEQIAAVIAVLAHFFSSCDIFENPPAEP